MTVISDVMSVPELVMKDFEPLTTHEASSCPALVRTAAASEPPPGSVRPKAASRSPRHSSGSQHSFCSSVPKR